MERMIETPATVIENTWDGGLWIETERHSACGHCASGASCGVSVLGKLGAGQRLRFRLPATDTLRAGDSIRLGIDGGQLIRVSVLAYLLPLITLLIGAGVADALGQAEGMVAMSAIIGLIAGLWFSGRIATRVGYQPELLKCNRSDHLTPGEGEPRTPRVDAGSSQSWKQIGDGGV